MTIGTRLRGGWEQLVFRGAHARGGEPHPPEVVLRFGFGRVPRARFGVRDTVMLPTRIPFWAGNWARRFVDIDGAIRDRFGETHRRAAEGALDHWADTPHGRLALVIVLDQMSRNMFRGTPAAFAQDAAVLPIVERALVSGDDQALNPLARTLFYLPLMHHEDPVLLDRCVGLYESAYSVARGVPRVVLGVELASAHRHREIVARFGRYPHRNVILGRESTSEEVAFLTEAFSSF